MSEFDEIFGDEFFIIDSNNIDEIESRLYGFIVSDNQIIQNEDIDKIKDISGLGTYLLVKNTKNEIKIYQDFNGGYGLYFYKNGDYFAISNSFLKLADYLKDNHVLTFNEEISESYITVGLVLAYSKTLINEIEVLHRNLVVTINKENKNVSFETIDYAEHTIPIDSEEGMKVLDNWHDKWIKIIRSIKAKTNNLQVSLSGGFDSRLSASLALAANIDFNKIKFYSIKSNTHTHGEDYIIASEIAENLGFELNKNTFSKGKKYFKEIETPIQLSNYLKLGFHNQMNYRYFRYEEPVYYISGGAGETIRTYYDKTPTELIEYFSRRPKRIEESFVPSVEKNLRYSFNKLQKEFNIEDSESKDIPDLLFSEMRCCSHFGKVSLEDYSSNRILLMPLLDPDLHKLQLTTDECEDKALLMALIFIRYYPKLLEFKFQGNRTIDEKTLNYVKDLCEKYPHNPKEYEYLSGPPIDSNRYEDEKTVLPQKTTEYFKNLFYSKQFEHEFKKYYPTSVYNWISKSIETRRYFPLSSLYPALGSLKAINIAEQSSNKKDNLMNWLNSFGNEKNEIKPEIVNSLLYYNTIRIDIIHEGEHNHINIFENSDPSSKILIPSWFCKESGQGVIVSSYKNHLHLKFKCINDGKLKIKFRSSNIRTPNNKFLPIHLDLTKLIVNDETIISNSNVITYLQGYVFSKEVKDSDNIDLYVEWKPANRNSNLK